MTWSCQRSKEDWAGRSDILRFIISSDRGRYLYVCGSVGVFDSVMSGIRRAIYNHRTSTMESTDIILNKAFAERRFMLDIFMTPKPLPCNAPAIPLSQLAMHTGHQLNSRLWIGVHGRVYDVTDFAPMHPGGSNIIKSNAGVDCSRSFDLLAHTNNPEVASLLSKYFIGELASKPNYSQMEDVSMLYDLWSSYLRTVVETLVASHFEMSTFIDSARIWFHGDLFNMGGVRRFYHYQSRLLQGGISVLFGAKLQEIYLKLSFVLASSSGSAGPLRLADVLGIVARAQSSSQAVATSSEVSQIGQFTANSDAARFHEKGIIAYASKSVDLDMEFLEEIRGEVCTGMDAFDAIIELDARSELQRVAALATFLMRVLERMANRLEGFYAKLARYSVFHPELERHPARTRWSIVRSKIFDGSFFVLAQHAQMGTDSSQKHQKSGKEGVDFDHIVNSIQQHLDMQTHSARWNESKGLNERHLARATNDHKAESEYESYVKEGANKAMSSFMQTNKRAIRRLSKTPQGVNLEQLLSTYGQVATPSGLPTPPSSRSSSLARRSPEFMQEATITPSRALHSAEITLASNTASSTNGAVMTPLATPTPNSPADVMSTLMRSMNTRSRSGHSQALQSEASKGTNIQRRRDMKEMEQPGSQMPRSSRSIASGSSLRAFRLRVGT